MVQMLAQIITAHIPVSCMLSPQYNVCSFPLLAANGLTFDAHVNWFQLKQAAEYFKAHPNVPIIVDHLGVLKLGKVRIIVDGLFAWACSSWARLACLRSILLSLLLIITALPRRHSLHRTIVTTLPISTLSALCCVRVQGAEEDARRIGEWREGMRALSDLPNVFCKISGLDYIRHGWITDPEANAVVKGLVKEAIEMFGVGRCMFASNFPVDL